MNGFINLKKPAGMSSAYAVGAVKKTFKCPCGHMGTLDPMAEGVLPVGVGQASRLFNFFLDKEKEYVAEFKFGVLTDTLDITGTVLKTCTVIPEEKDIIEATKAFVGEIEQVPPNYSAKCIDGKRGYQLARRGEEFTLPPKKVVINSFEYLEKTDLDTFKFKINCKGGTYIRSLARDLGEKLGSLGTMKTLVRTKSGVFTLDTAVDIEQLKNEENPERLLVPSDQTVGFTRLTLSALQAKRLLDGLKDKYPLKDGLYRVYNGNEFWGVGEISLGTLKMKAYVR